MPATPPPARPASASPEPVDVRDTHAPPPDAAQNALAQLLMGVFGKSLLGNVVALALAGSVASSTGMFPSKEAFDALVQQQKESAERQANMERTLDRMALTIQTMNSDSVTREEVNMWITEMQRVNRGQSIEWVPLSRVSPRQPYSYHSRDREDQR